MVLTGNNLGRLGNVEKLPSSEELEEYGKHPVVQEYKVRFQNDEESFVFHMHQFAKEKLEEGFAEEAWKILLQKK